MRGIIFLFLINFVHSAKILGIFSMPSLSHHILGSKIISELVERGHHVTLVTPYPDIGVIKSDTARDRLKLISVEDNLSVLSGYSKSSSLNREDHKEEDQAKKTKKSFFDREAHTTIETIIYLQDLSFQIAEKTLSNENVQNLLKSSQKFDLILMEYFLNEAYFALGKHFDAPVVLLSTLPSSPFNNYLFSNPSLPSYVPHILSPFGTNMDLWQRFQNSFYSIFDIIYKHVVMLPKHKLLAEKYISKDVVFDEVLYNASLLLVNSHLSLGMAVPHVNNVIEIGGFHIDKEEKAHEIPASLKNELDNAKSGAIVFSLGSNLNCDDLPVEKLNAIIETFAKMKETVFWKWESDSGRKLPENVRRLKWFPQQLVLRHPNVKAFVTHGGLLSMIEAVHAGVPVVGIPIYGDQRMNLAIAVDAGYGIMVPYGDLTYEVFSSALREVLYNKSYKQNATLRSKILKDQPVDPLDSAIYWIEYVIRYRGASHLRSPSMNLTWYQRNMLDIIIILTFISISLFVIFYVIFKHIVHCRYTRKICRTYELNKKDD